MFCEKDALKNSQENTCAKVSLQRYKKETLAQMFCRECFKILKKIFLYRTPLIDYLAVFKNLWHVSVWAFPILAAHPFSGATHPRFGPVVVVSDI